MSSDSAHQHGPLWRLFHWGEQPQRHTDETPVVQPQFHIIHQDTARRMHNRFLAWCDEQPVLNPRLIEHTGPRLRERAGHEQEVRPKLAEYKPPQFTPSNGMQRLPSTPIPDAPSLRQARALNIAELPPWIQQLRDGSLLVPSQPNDADLPKDATLMTLPGSNTPSAGLPKIDITGNTLATAHIGRRSQPLDVPRRDELPTTPTMGKIVEQSLPPFIGGGEMPPVEQVPFPEQSWLNGVELIEVWGEPEPPVLKDLASGEIATVDRIAEPRPVPAAWDQLETLAHGQPDDDTVEVPTVMRKQHTKESEK